MASLATPDITPQSIGAGLILVATNVEILLGHSLSRPREAALEALINGAAVLGFLAHDAIVRHGRSNVAAAQVSAAAYATSSAIPDPAPATPTA